MTIPEQPTTPPERPAVPTYGEYAPVSPLVPPPPGPAPYQAGYQTVAPVRPRRIWDVVLSCILLTVGLFGALFGAVVGADLGPAITSQFQAQGIGGTAPPWIGAGGLLIIVSHVVLYLLALGITIPMLVKRRIAFWVPLTAGVLAALIYVAVVAAAIFSNPAFLSQYGG